MPSAHRFGILWHPAASDKGTSCQSSSVGLSQVGLRLIWGMALSGAFRPLGLVLPSAFLVRDWDWCWVYLSGGVMVTCCLSYLNNSLTCLSY
jgi:hypothetical protein